MNSENNEKSMILLRGFADDESKYYFNNCLVTYRDGNGNPNDDFEKVYDEEGNQIFVMPQGYFISPNPGTHAYVNGCTFYCNHEVYLHDSEQGFVKKSFLEQHMTCTIDSETKCDQKLVITDNTPSTENGENQNGLLE